LANTPAAHPEKHLINASAAHRLRARWVFPVTAPPIADGVVTIVGDRVAEVSSHCDCEAEDLGNVAIVPGLVNVHTHLNLSDLAEPLGGPEVGFADWIRRVIGHRRRVAGEYRQAVAKGLLESARLGATTIGDIAQPAVNAASSDAGRLSGTIFLELIAPTAARVAPTLELAHRWLAETQKTEGRGEGAGFGGQVSSQEASALCLGLSPHAPYTVHAELLSRVVSLSAAERVPIAMHLAESREELQLLGSHDGPLRKLMEELDAWDPAAIPRGTRPLHYLRTLAEAYRALVVHGNYLDDEEIAFLAAHRECLSVAYCPRTHSFFDHGPYRLEKMLAAGVCVALGTDSRASSPDLSVLAEMRCVAQRHPSVDRPRVLRMGTIDGARVLGRDHELGSLEPGKFADLAIIALPDRDTADPHNLLFHASLPVVATWRRGRVIMATGE
jgi:aminodeoxyfutalosine deaminase